MVCLQCHTLKPRRIQLKEARFYASRLFLSSLLQHSSTVFTNPIQSFSIEVRRLYQCQNEKWHALLEGMICGEKLVDICKGSSICVGV
jgi:hypothetical protein